MSMLPSDLLDDGDAVGTLSEAITSTINPCLSVARHMPGVNFLSHLALARQRPRPVSTWDDDQTVRSTDRLYRQTVQTVQYTVAVIGTQVGRAGAHRGLLPPKQIGAALAS